MSNSHVGRYVDAEVLVVTWLNDQGAISPARAVTKVPQTIPDGGVLWVATVGGPSDWSEAKIRVDVQSLVPGGDGAASDLAGIAHAAMDALGGSFVGDQYVNAVYCRTVPVARYWSDTVDRRIGTYELHLPVL